MPESTDSRRAPHKPADDREEVYYEGSPQTRAAKPGRSSPPACSAAALLAGGGLSCSSPDSGPSRSRAFVLAILAQAIPIIFTKSVRYRFSNYRIDYERGILSRRIDTLELWHVEDISFNQSLLNRMLGVGNIEVISHDDTTPKLMLRGLPTPRPCSNSSSSASSREAPTWRHQDGRVDDCAGAPIADTAW
jgi:hypothetical protein